ncbi:DUF5058 family protein [Mangrovicoccus sp. HB161399]|uniref:DUF5058 family protein n=1 Tax=Mangrovicoccus sp. HB161399 TaxID=2720392 RepID=UPI001553772D|nr:DUF5058 family protein [Mangrovicoccus sp. HB161399]
MEQVLQTANSPVLWLLSCLVVSTVVVQAALYLRLTLGFSNRFGILTPAEKRTVCKTAAINSIGPAVAVFFVAISLVAMVGGPVTLMRVGVIGSAIFEFVAADQGAKAVGAELGTQSYTLEAFTASVWVMTLGGMGWLASTFFMTKGLDRAQDKLGSSNPALIKAMGTATPIAIFFILGANAAIDKDWLSGISVETDDLAAILAAAGAMTALHLAGRARPWLREWSVGFALLAGLAAGAAAAQFA